MQVFCYDGMRNVQKGGTLMKWIYSMIISIIVLSVGLEVAYAADNQGVELDKSWEITFTKPLYIDASIKGDKEAVSDFYAQFVCMINDDVVDQFTSCKTDKTVAVSIERVNDTTLNVRPNGVYSGKNYTIYVDGIQSQDGEIAPTYRETFETDNSCAYRWHEEVELHTTKAVHFKNPGGSNLHICSVGHVGDTPTYLMKRNYSSMAQGYYYPYVGESALYYAVNIDGQLMHVSKNDAEVVELGNNVTTYYTVEQRTLYRHIWNGTTYKKLSSYGAVTPNMEQKLTDGQKYYSTDGGITLSETPNGPAIVTSYRYFQNVSLRTPSAYREQELRHYIEQYVPANSVIHKEDFARILIDTQQQYNINATFLLAFALHESAAGTSCWATEANNIYSYKVVDGMTCQSPEHMEAAKHDSIAANTEAMAKWLNVQYGQLGEDYANGFVIGNKAYGLNTRYATDPHWGAGIAHHYGLIDEQLGGKERNHYELARVWNNLNYINIHFTGTNSRTHYYTNNRPLTLVTNTMNNAGRYEVFSDYDVARTMLIHESNMQRFIERR